MGFNEWKDEDWEALIYTIDRQNCILMLGPDASFEEVNGQNSSLTTLLANKLAESIDALGSSKKDGLKILKKVELT